MPAKVTLHLHQGLVVRYRAGAGRDGGVGGGGWPGARIESGQIGPREALPSITYLTGETGLAVGTVRKAIGVLVDEGLGLHRPRSRDLRHPTQELTSWRF